MLIAYISQNSGSKIIVTMPNVDAHNKIIRKELEQLIKEENHIWGFENLGTLAYFSCMKHCAFVLGNSSSGIIEAPSLKKYFINLGNRQIGRQCDLNVINCRINAQEILRTTVKLKEKTKLTGANIYRYGDVSDNIKKLKTIPHVKKCNSNWLFRTRICCNRCAQVSREKRNRICRFS